MSCNLYKNCTHCNTDMITITGLCTASDITNIISTNPYWSETFINQILTIPSTSPNISSILSIDITVTALKLEVLKTPSSTGTNMEDVALTGRAIMFGGEAKQTIVYSSNDPLNPIYSVTFYVPFSSYIVVPSDITFINGEGDTITDDPLNMTFAINSCVKYIDICLIDNASLRTNLLVLFYAVSEDI